MKIEQSRSTVVAVHEIDIDIDASTREHSTGIAHIAYVDRKIISFGGRITMVNETKQNNNVSERMALADSLVTATKIAEGYHNSKVRIWTDSQYVMHSVRKTLENRRYEPILRKRIESLLDVSLSLSILWCPRGQLRNVDHLSQLYCKENFSEVVILPSNTDLISREKYWNTWTNKKKKAGHINGIVARYRVVGGGMT